VTTLVLFNIILYTILNLLLVR